MKLWKGKKEESKPKPYLDFDEELDWVVLDINGKRITFVKASVSAIYGNTKEVIEKAGYSTSWAEWDKDGRFVRMLEEIEE